MAALSTSRSGSVEMCSSSFIHHFYLVAIFRDLGFFINSKRIKVTPISRALRYCKFMHAVAADIPVEDGDLDIRISSFSFMALLIAWLQQTRLQYRCSGSREPTH